MDLLFAAWQRFAALPDPLLAERGLGRAHLRVMELADRHPDATMSELQDALRLTKQTLARTVAPLFRRRLVEKAPAPRDGRARRLVLTDLGRATLNELRASQRRRFAAACRQAGAEAVEGYRAVLEGLLDEPAPQRRLGS